MNQQIKVSETTNIDLKSGYYIHGVFEILFSNTTYRVPHRRYSGRMGVRAEPALILSIQHIGYGFGV
jgi:hypothetical protein